MNLLYFDVFRAYSIRLMVIINSYPVFLMMWKCDFQKPLSSAPVIAEVWHIKKKYPDSYRCVDKWIVSDFENADTLDVYWAKSSCRLLKLILMIIHGESYDSFKDLSCSRYNHKLISM